MFSLNDIIKYVGFALITYFLLKAFANNKLSNKEISLIVLIITIMVIIICSQKSNCSKNRFETFANMESDKSNKSSDANPIGSGTGTRTGIESGNKLSPENKNVQELAKLFGIDLDKYNQIIDRENNVKKQIKSKYTNDMIHTTTNPLNTIPLGASIYGYTYLPPENWFRAYEMPPVCHSFGGNTKIHYPAPKSTEGLLELDTIGT